MKLTESTSFGNGKPTMITRAASNKHESKTSFEETLTKKEDLRGFVVMTRSSSENKHQSTVVDYSPLNLNIRADSSDAIAGSTRSSCKQVDTASKSSLAKPKVLFEHPESAASNANVIRQEVKHQAKKDMKDKRQTPIKEVMWHHKDGPLKIYWDSTEAKNLFRPLEGETVLEAVQNQIDVLDAACIGNKRNDIVDPNGIWKEYRLKMKATVVSAALDIAKKDKPLKTWAQCCKEAVSLSYSKTDYAELKPDVKPPSCTTVSAWYREFREERYFPSEKKLRDKELASARKKAQAFLDKIMNGMAKVKIQD